MSTNRKRKCNSSKDDDVNSEGFLPAAGSAEDDGGKMDNGCGKADCEETVKKGERNIKCERCRKWFHIRCGKISVEEFNAINKVNSAMWFCPPCRGSVVETLDFVEELREENKKLKQEMNVLEDKILGMKADIVKEVKQCLTHDMLETVKNRVIEELKEKDDKETRKRNIVMYGVEESSAETPEEREREDTNVCCDIIENAVGVKDFRILSTKRLGKKGENDSRVRPVLLELSESKMKWDIIKSAGNLKIASQKYRNVSIVPTTGPN